MTYEETMDYVRRNAHRFSKEQRDKMIAECCPGFLGLMQIERDKERKQAMTSKVIARNAVREIVDAFQAIHHYLVFVRYLYRVWV